MVDKTHDMSKQHAIEEIGEESGLIEKNTDEVNESEEKDKGALSSLIGKVKDGASSTLATAKEVPKKMNALLDNLIDEVAYFFVSICVIPIVVLVVLIVLLKQILGIRAAETADYMLLVKEIRKIKADTKEPIE